MWMWWVQVTLECILIFEGWNQNDRKETMTCRLRMCSRFVLGCSRKPLVLVDVKPCVNLLKILTVNIFFGSVLIMEF